jgi:hypothetical protein
MMMMMMMMMGRRRRASSGPDMRRPRRSAIKSSVASPPARLLDPRSLYNGKGGKYFPSPVDENAISTASDDVASTVAVDSPRPYDEIGAGPQTGEHIRCSRWGCPPDVGRTSGQPTTPIYR